MINGAKVIMSVRSVASTFGIVFLLAGLAGFVPGLSPEHDYPDMLVTAGSRLALGLFPVNVLHNLVHLAFGLWALLAARSMLASRLYLQAVALIYGVLTVLGLIPLTMTTFGLVPIGGNDVWLHAGLAIVAGFFGFMQRRSTESRLRA